MEYKIFYKDPNSSNTEIEIRYNNGIKIHEIFFNTINISKTFIKMITPRSNIIYLTNYPDVDILDKFSVREDNDVIDIGIHQSNKCKLQLYYKVFWILQRLDGMNRYYFIYNPVTKKVLRIMDNIDICINAIKTDIINLALEEDYKQTLLQLQTHNSLRESFKNEIISIISEIPKKE